MISSKLIDSLYLSFIKLFELKLRKHFFLLLVLVIQAIGPTLLYAQENLPLDKNGPLTPIRDLRCDGLESKLKEVIFKNPKWKNLVSSKRMAIGIVSFEDLESIKYAGLNDDHMMYAASLPKIAVLLAAFDAIEKGKLKYTAELNDNLKLMISKSNNAATTKVIDQLGFESIENTLRNTNHKLYDEETGGGLWVGKRYAKSGVRKPDPLAGLSHGATASQVASFYYQLVFGHLISKERSAQMLKILKDPELSHKFVNTLKTIAPDTDIYRKSGSWKNYHSDSVLVWGKDRKYIMVALIEDAGGEQIIRDLVIPLESALEVSSSLRCN